ARNTDRDVGEPVVVEVAGSPRPAHEVAGVASGSDGVAAKPRADLDDLVVGGRTARAHANARRGRAPPVEEVDGTGLRVIPRCADRDVWVPVAVEVTGGAGRAEHVAGVSFLDDAWRVLTDLQRRTDRPV